jgi:hypothetical protein
MRGTRAKRWSADEIARLMSLHQKFATKRYGIWPAIVAQMPGRSMLQCQEKVRYQKYGREYRRKYGAYKIGKDQTLCVVAVHVPADVLREAAYRRRLSRSTLTAEFCGDPLPGYSALDRRA